MQQTPYNQQRYFLKDSIRKTIDFSKTDQSLGFPPPPIEKPYKSNQDFIPLVPSSKFLDQYKIDLQYAIGNRESRPEIFNEINVRNGTFLFIMGNTGNKKTNRWWARTQNSPICLGARHALETHLAILNVETVDKGFYRYLPIEHKLVVESLDTLVAEKITQACFHQNWIADAAVFFIWTAMPERMEWRYGLAAHRVILIDAGHVCQNLYLACEATGAGTCAIAAYDQERLDDLLRLDGNNEFVIYTAAVGNLI